MKCDCGQEARELPEEGIEPLCQGCFEDYRDYIRKEMERAGLWSQEEEES